MIVIERESVIAKLLQFSVERYLFRFRFSMLRTERMYDEGARLSYFLGLPQGYGKVLFVTFAGGVNGVNLLC